MYCISVSNADRVSKIPKKCVCHLSMANKLKKYGPQLDSLKIWKAHTCDGKKVLSSLLATSSGIRIQDRCFVGSESSNTLTREDDVIR